MLRRAGGIRGASRHPPAPLLQAIGKATVRADKTTRGAEYGHEKRLKQAKSTLQEAEAMLAQRWAVPVGMGDTVGFDREIAEARAACVSAPPACTRFRSTRRERARWLSPPKEALRSE